MDEAYSTYLDFAREFVINKGRIALEEWGKARVVSTEDSGNNVSTNIDKQIEQDFYDELQERFPEHGFQGEEFPELNREADLTWYIDPIDGSKWYAKGVPLWSSVITLVQKADTPWGKEALLCVVYNPVSGQFYQGRKDQGAFLNGQKLLVDSSKKLQDAQISFDFPVSDKMKSAFETAKSNPSDAAHALISGQSWDEFYKSRLQALAGLYESCYRVRDIGAGPFSFCWLAQGFFSGVVAPCQHSSKIVDHLGPALIAKEAGAVVEFGKLSGDLNWFVAGANEGVVGGIKEIFAL